MLNNGLKFVIFWFNIETGMFELVQLFYELHLKWTILLLFDSVCYSILLNCYFILLQSLPMQTWHCQLQSNQSNTVTKICRWSALFSLGETIIYWGTKQVWFSHYKNSENESRFAPLAMHSPIAADKTISTKLAVTVNVDCKYQYFNELMEEIGRFKLDISLKLKQPQQPTTLKYHAWDFINFLYFNAVFDMKSANHWLLNRTTVFRACITTYFIQKDYTYWDIWVFCIEWFSGLLLNWVWSCARRWIVPDSYLATG